MITVCWAAKGGSGTTVVASSIALSESRANPPEPTLLIDLAGDVPATLGLPEPDSPGVLDWIRSDAPAPRLAGLEIAARHQLTVLPRGLPNRHSGDIGSPRLDEFGAWVGAQRRRVVIDAGSTPPPSPLATIADHLLLVTRPCYLALRAAAGQPLRPTGVIMIDEPGRALSAGDIESAIGAPVVATLLLDPAVARAVDAGLLASRLPRAYARQLRRAA